MRHLVRWSKHDSVSSVLGFTALGWGVLAVLLLSWSSAPRIQSLSDAGQHFVIGLALSLFSGGAVAARWRWQGQTIGWVVLTATTVLLFMLELIQILVPGRSFQWEDLAFGSFGAVLGGATVTLGVLLGRRYFITASAGVGVATLLVACIAVVAADSGPSENKPEELVADCVGGPEGVDWSLVVVDFGMRNGDCIETAIGPMAAFGEPLAPQSSELELTGGGLAFTGGGLASATLDGLAAAVGATSEVTFGVRFAAGRTGDVSPPIVLARLIIDENPNRPFVQVLQRGPHLASNTGSGRPTVGVGSVLADTLEPGVPHEYVVTYADGEAVTYLDGQPLARSTAPPMRFEIDAGLSLEVGWRADERWRPFIGRVHAVAIGDRALSPDEVKRVFEGR